MEEDVAAVAAAEPDSNESGGAHRAAPEPVTERGRRTRAQLIEAARRVVFCIDSSKFGRQSISRLCDLEVLDTVVGKLIDEHRKKKTLNEKPIRFDLARFREAGDTPLFFPGKVVADEKGKRLFIADSTHHRVVVTDLDGNKLNVFFYG